MIQSLIPFFVALSIPSPDPGETVYDNTTTYLHVGMPLLATGRKNSAEVGDEIYLGGTAREATELRVRFFYYGTIPGTFDARIRFRTLQNGVMTPGPAKYKEGQIVGYDLTEKPGAAFFEGDIVKGLKIEPGMNEYTFKVPHVKVPDRFIWTVQCYNNTDAVGEYGPAYYDPPTVGSSKDFFWHSDMGSPWIAYSWGNSPYANFAARLYAVGGSAVKAKSHPVVPPR